MSKELNLKLKTNKKPIQDCKTTLDAIHQKHLEKIGGIGTELTELKEKLNALSGRRATATLDESYALDLQLKRTTDAISRLEGKDDLMDYYLKTGPLLYEYYDIQDKISSGAQIQATHKVRPGSIFAALEEAAAQDKASDATSSNTGEGNAGGFAGYGIDMGSSNSNLSHSVAAGSQKKYAPPPVFSREKLLDSYLRIVDPESTRQGNSTTDTTWSECRVCATDMIFNINEAYITCPSCGFQESVLIDSDKPSYKDPPREVSYYAYKRINHFNEWLAQFQAKESTDIPQEVFDQIIIELKKERITNMAAVKQSKLKEILKKIKFNKYEHVPHILSRLNGQNAPVMSRENEEKFRVMFKEIQPSFQRHCPPERKNFLSYGYVLYKFCELLELDEFLPCFPLLKNRDKLYQQDKIWQKICEDMKWEFIRTL
jgi:hypothetical protein